MTNPDFDLPAFLLDKLYDNMDWDDGWTLSDAIALAEDIRRYDGIDCDPQEIYEIMRRTKADPPDESRMGIRPKRANRAALPGASRETRRSHAPEYDGRLSP